MVKLVNTAIRIKPRKNPKSMISLQSELIKKKLSVPEFKQKYDSLERRVLVNDGTPQAYTTTRRYEDYNTILTRCFPENKIFKDSILHTLLDYARTTKKETIKALDDGAGMGKFLFELKNRWNDIKDATQINTNLETTAISLTPNKVVVPGIDHIIYGNVAKFEPSQKYDFIFSVYGGFHYSVPVLRKEILLKYVYSLNKGGSAIFGFNFNDIYAENFRSQEIITALKKRGFYAEYKFTPHKVVPNNSSYDLPYSYLLVKRLK